MRPGSSLNPRHWPKHHRIGLFVMVIFGACIGFIAGLRRVDASVNQDLYWIWLSVWIVSASLIAAAAVFVYRFYRSASETAERRDR